MNKKTLLTSLLLYCLTIVAFAQENKQVQYTVPSSNEYLLKDPVWYMSLGAGGQFIIGTDDSKMDFKNRITFAPTFTVGRRLGNLFGIRLQFTGGSLHGINDGDSGIYTKWTKEKFYNPSMNTFDPQWEYMGWTERTPSNPTGEYERYYDAPTGATVWRAVGGENANFYMQHFRYLALAGDFSLNFFNLVEGYKPNRKVELNPFVGLIGLQRFAHMGTLNESFLGASLGLNLAVNLTRNFGLHTDFRTALISQEFEGIIGDMNYNGLLQWTAGVTYRFGDPRYIDPSLETRLNMPYNIAQAKDKMVLVPGGNIELGTGIDPLWGDEVPRKLVSVSPFWMDETEVTNRQYREFVYWVRDSIIRERLADPQIGGDPSFKITVKSNSRKTVEAQQRLNWDKAIPWKNPNPRQAAAIASVVSENTTLKKGGVTMYLLDYKYDWYDVKSHQAFLADQRINGKAITITKDTAFIDSHGQIVRETLTRLSYGDPIDFTNTYIVNVYPDVLSWSTDFANAKSEQYPKMYFSTSKYDNFPVVGVSWKQAEAYCSWRTDRYLEANGRRPGFEAYRLPTEAEWEYAARNGRSDMTYPWHSNKTHTSDGLAHANFRGSKDLKDLTSPVATFLPNRFGLYDMAGNVAEWTSTSFIESVDRMTDEVNPDYSYRAVSSDPNVLKRKIVKGGSWKDASIKPGERDVEFQDKARSYIGFRCVRSWNPESRK